MTPKQMSVFNNRVIYMARDYGYSPNFRKWWIENEQHFDELKPKVEALGYQDSQYLTDLLFQCDWQKITDFLDNLKTQSTDLGSELLS